MAMGAMHVHGLRERTWPRGHTSALFDSDVTDAAQVYGFLMLGLVREREHSRVCGSECVCNFPRFSPRRPPRFAVACCGEVSQVVRWRCDGGTHRAFRIILFKTSGQEASNSPLWCTATNGPPCMVLVGDMHHLHATWSWSPHPEQGSFT